MYIEQINSEEFKSMAKNALDVFKGHYSGETDELVMEHIVGMCLEIYFKEWSRGEWLAVHAATHRLAEPIKNRRYKVSLSLSREPGKFGAFFQKEFWAVNQGSAMLKYLHEMLGNNQGLVWVKHAKAELL